jgi:hypothetical protein
VARLHPLLTAVWKKVDRAPSLEVGPRRLVE